MKSPSIASRYLGARFLLTWVTVLAGFIVLYTTIDFMEKIGHFMGSEMNAGRIFLFFAAQLPKVIGLMTPVAALVATIVTLNLMARNSEIVAFKAGGVSLFRLSRPLLAAGLGLSLVSFVLAEGLAPRAPAAANQTWEEARRGHQVSTVVTDLWMKGVHLVEHIERYEEADGTASGLTIFFTGGDQTAMRRLSAERGRFADGRKPAHSGLVAAGEENGQARGRAVGLIVSFNVFHQVDAFHPQVGHHGGDLAAPAGFFPGFVGRGRGPGGQAFGQDEGDQAQAEARGQQGLAEAEEADSAGFESHDLRVPGHKV
jgi:hypothetical protein